MDRLGLTFSSRVFGLFYCG